MEEVLPFIKPWSFYSFFFLKKNSKDKRSGAILTPTQLLRSGESLKSRILEAQPDVEGP